ncbi:uncharacterized protein LOC118203376 [Stegodyphus dumicola]|uniref:uncharacterized protein LOC118203376 n=1 Tax=Stegodyphus dumicola TaxID=202533 RepID=UPI0015AA520C|nr:uncharacterized protein LOC118203376 [Stegodyphus dumicola]
MQALWLLKLDWAEQLPPPLANEWNVLIKTLQSIENIQVPRCILKETFSMLILQGFADASEKAFGAVIYLQSITSPGEYCSKLLCSKSRVAPIKTMTIPRLELSACLLLSKLMQKVLEALKLKIDDVDEVNVNGASLALQGTVWKASNFRSENGGIL